MKKIISVLLVCIMILALAACGKEAVLSAYSQGLNEDGLYNLKASDYIALPELEGIEISASEKVADESSIQSQINSLLSSYKTVNQITDRAIADGDSVNIDYSGSIDGVQFDGGTATGQSVIAGAQNFIDDFLTQIIGHKAGETFDVNVTFPDTYSNNPDLAGKDAVFVVTINYIEETVYPELTDEFVAENFGDSGFNTVADIREYFAESIVETQVTTWVENYLFENSTCSSIPDEVLNHQKSCTKASLDDNAAYYGVDLSTLLQVEGFESADQMIETYIDDVKNMAITALMFQAAAEQLNIKVTKGDIADYFTRKTGTSDYSSSEEHYGLPYLKLMVMNDKVVQYVVDHSK